MGIVRHSLSLLLVGATLIGISRAEVTPRLKTSWKEKAAGVVRFAPDGRTLVSSSDKGYQLRDAATGAVRAILQNSQRWGYELPVYTPDSRLLLVQVASDRLPPLIVHDVQVWDVASGQIRQVFPFVAERFEAGGFALSPDGRYLAFVDHSQRYPAQIRMRQFAGGSVDSHTFPPFEVPYNGNPVPSRIKIWDLATGTEAAVVDGLSPLAFTPDGKTLATGGPKGKNREIRCWDVPTGVLRSVLGDQQPGFGTIVFSPDSRFLAEIGHAGHVQSLQEVASGRRWPIEWQQGMMQVGPPYFSLDTRWLYPASLPTIIAGAGQAEESACLDLTTLPPTRVSLGPDSVIMAPDGRRYATLPRQRPGDRPVPLIVFDMASRSETGRVILSRPLSVSFSPDGRWIAAQMVRNEGVSPIATERWMSEVALIDPATALQVATFKIPGRTYGDFSWTFAPDGNSLALTYHRETGIIGPGQPKPSDPPITVEVWDISAH